MISAVLRLARARRRLLATRARVCSCEYESRSSGSATAGDAGVEGRHGKFVEVRAGLLGQRLAHFVACEHVVAVVSLKTACAVLAQHLVERAVGAAVGVGDSETVAVQRMKLRVDGGGDPLRPVVQLRRQRPDLDVPAAIEREPANVERERPQAYTHSQIVKAIGRDRSLKRRGRELAYSTTLLFDYAAAAERSCTETRRSSRPRGDVACRYSACQWPRSA